MHRHIAVGEAPFDPGAEHAALRAAAPGAGAIATFTGLVRDQAGDAAVHGLHLEHYPGMTERSVEDVVDEAARRWTLAGVRIVHRVGELAPGEEIVWVGVAAGHRAAAFDACRFVMDYLKTRAVFWKKERYADGERWIDSTAGDHAAAEAWSRQGGRGS